MQSPKLLEILLDKRFSLLDLFDRQKKPSTDFIYSLRLKSVVSAYSSKHLQVNTTSIHFEKNQPNGSLNNEYLYIM